MEKPIGNGLFYPTINRGPLQSKHNGDATDKPTTAGKLPTTTNNGPLTTDHGQRTHDQTPA